MLWKIYPFKNDAMKGERQVEGKKIRVGSRESKLAVLQTQLVMEEIHRRHPEIQLELVTMKTTGDRILDRPLSQVGGKGLFVRELDAALREGRVDLTVHSLKDLPMEQEADLPLLAFCRREDPRDVLILPKGMKEPPSGKPIGSSSPRRELQLRKLYPQLEVKSVRGNVLTRLEKLDRGEYGALVLAYAGVKRLGLENRISRIFSPEEILPAAGQGVLAVQGRAGEPYPFLEEVDHQETRVCALGERAFVRALNGGCTSPTAAYGRLEKGILKLTGLYCQPDTRAWATASIEGPPEEAEALGLKLAKQLGGLV